jgi:fumarate hydratase, class I
VTPDPDFQYSDLLPVGTDETPYRLLTTEGVSRFEANGKKFLQVSPEAIQLLTSEAMHDISHYLRPAPQAHQRTNIHDHQSTCQHR